MTTGDNTDERVPPVSDDRNPKSAKEKKKKYLSEASVHHDEKY